MSSIVIEEGVTVIEQTASGSSTVGTAIGDYISTLPLGGVISSVFGGRSSSSSSSSSSTSSLGPYRGLGPSTAGLTDVINAINSGGDEAKEANEIKKRKR